ncbi:MAG: response regulator [Oligoflexia bacterium]|nr:response regulator [Oligoflexia bacterium]
MGSTRFSAVISQPPAGSRACEVVDEILDGNCFPASESPQTILSSLSEARLLDFHQNRRILVIDDVPETGRRFAGALAQLYGKVEFETDPVSALARIQESCAQGTPYDAIVLDLYMPKMQGTEVLAKLGDSAPAVVINTASMMAPIVGELAYAIDSYVAGKAQALFEELKAERSSMGLPTVAIFTHHKLDALAALVDKLDTAMLIRQFVTDSTSQFLANFQPTLTEVVFTEETLHFVAEDVHNFAVALAPLLAADRDHPALRGSEWWNANRESTQQAFAAIAATSFSSLVGETPGLTISKLHSLVNNLGLLEPPSPDIFDRPEDAECRRLLRVWDSQWRKLKGALNSRYVALQQYHSGELDVGSLISKLFPKAVVEIGTAARYSYEPEYEEELSPLIKDPDRLIRTFLTDLMAAFRSRISFADTSGTSRVSVWATLCGEYNQGEIWMPEAHVRQFARMNCGHYWKINLGDETGRTLDQDFGSLAPAISMLQRSGLAFIETLEEQDGSNFIVYLKAGEKAADYIAEIDKIAEEKIKKPDGTWIYNERGEDRPYKVQEDLGKTGDIIAIGDLPDRRHRYKKPILYRHAELRIWCDASDSSHQASAFLINDILAELQAKAGDAAGAKARRLESSTRESIYREGIRVLYEGDRLILELSPKDLKTHWAFQTLVELGVPAKKIEANPFVFLAR